MMDAYQLRFDPDDRSLHYGTEVAKLARIVTASFSQAARGKPGTARATLQTIDTPGIAPARLIVFGMRVMIWTLVLRVSDVTGETPERVLNSLLMHFATTEAA